MLLLSTLNKVFVRDKASAAADDADRRLWEVRFEHARKRLQRAGISVAEDVSHSRETYVECRRGWDTLVRRLGAAMAYHPAEIDRAIKRP